MSICTNDIFDPAALSRLIKKPEQPFNDGHRHMIKYSRFNQTIQIIVDHQSYLPTMSVITTNHINKFSSSSSLMIGTSIHAYQNYKKIARNETSQSHEEYLDFGGCISSK